MNSITAISREEPKNSRVTRASSRASTNNVQPLIDLKEKLGVEQACEAIGISSPSFYKYVNDKSAPLVAIKAAKWELNRRSVSLPAKRTELMFIRTPQEHTEMVTSLLRALDVHITKVEV